MAFCLILKPVKSPYFTCSDSFSFVVPLVVTRCHSLPFVITPCQSSSLIFIHYHSFSFVVTHCTTRCHWLYHSLSFVVTHCHLLSLVVTRCHSSVQRTTRLSFYKQFSYRHQALYDFIFT